MLVRALQTTAGTYVEVAIGTHDVFVTADTPEALAEARIDEGGRVLELGRARSGLRVDLPVPVERRPLSVTVCHGVADIHLRRRET